MNYQQFWDGLPGLLVLVTCIALVRLIWSLGSFVGEIARSRQLTNDQREVATEAAAQSPRTAATSLPKSEL